MSRISNLDKLYTIPAKPESKADAFLTQVPNLKKKVFFDRALIHKKKKLLRSVAPTLPSKTGINLAPIAESQKATKSMSRRFALAQAEIEGKTATLDYLTGKDTATPGFRHVYKGRIVKDTLKQLPQSKHRFLPLPPPKPLEEHPLAIAEREHARARAELERRLREERAATIRRGYAAEEMGALPFSLEEKEEKKSLPPASAGPAAARSAAAAAFDREAAIREAKRLGWTALKVVKQFSSLYVDPSTRSLKWTIPTDENIVEAINFGPPPSTTPRGRGIHHNKRGRKRLPDFGANDAYRQAQIIMGEIDAHNDSKILKNRLASLLQYLHYCRVIPKELYVSLVRQYVGNP